MKPKTLNRYWQAAYVLAAGLAMGICTPAWSQDEDLPDSIKQGLERNIEAQKAEIARLNTALATSKTAEADAKKKQTEAEAALKNKTCPKPDEPKPCPKVTPKVCPKSDEPKPCPKPAEPRVCPKPDEPKPCPKPAEPRVCPKPDEPKPAPPQACPKCAETKPCPKPSAPQVHHGKPSGGRATKQPAGPAKSESDEGPLSIVRPKVPADAP